jgi:hypothetical protein
MRSRGLLALVPVLCLAAPVRAEVFCPECGNRYPDSYRYCPKDGTDLAAARAAARGSRQDAAKAAQQRTERSEDWAAALPIHLPSVYPDANLGDFSLLEWTGPDRTVFFRAVVRRGNQGDISVVAADLPWPRSKGKLPSLAEVLALLGPDNARRLELLDYRDFTRSFSAGGRPLLSPFVGGGQPRRTRRQNHPIHGGTVGCEVAEYPTRRGGRDVVHLVKTSEQVPYAFVESTYEGLDERLHVFLFGTLDEDELAPLQAAFPAR